jgi:hypothetical protein
MERHGHLYLDLAHQGQGFHAVAPVLRREGSDQQAPYSPYCRMRHRLAYRCSLRIAAAEHAGWIMTNSFLIRLMRLQFLPYIKLWNIAAYVGKRRAIRPPKSFFMRLRWINRIS